MTMRKKIGSDRTMSTKRMRTLSTLPPKKPAIAPRVTPIDRDDDDRHEADEQRRLHALRQAQEDVLADLVVPERRASGVWTAVAS